MDTRNLLVELFVEELPPKSLKQLGASFAELMLNSLVQQALVNKDTKVKTFASPRRLAVWIADVAAQAEDKQVSKKLMPVKVGLDEAGNATPALIKKLESMGLDAAVVSQLHRISDGKMEALFYDAVETGVTLAAGLQKVLEDTIAKLPIAKVMTYQLQNGWDTVNFVRPVHGLIALFGNEVLPVQLLGLQASNTTQGHRFEASEPILTIQHADEYEQVLKQRGRVLANFAERRAEIVAQLDKAAQQLNLKPVEDDALLDEVTALVEYPNVVLGQFEEEFLAVPPECLILTMKANQKYFPLLDAADKLTNKFLIVSNISPADASLVIQGNERVVRPRLADAKFFFDQDRKKSLAARVEGLDKVVYHNKLGTQGERVKRVQKIASTIARQLGGEELAMQAEQMAALAKTDLLTDMVGEFPELQGIMGRYYALHDGLSEEMAFSIEDHYKPRYAGDSLPRSTLGVCVALADKMETLAGLFGIGQIPTGDKDPFALRRHALGVLRMLIERELPVTLADLVQMSYAGFPTDLLQANQAELSTFMLDRLTGLMRDQGYSAQEVDAVLSLNVGLLYQIPKKLEAVRSFSNLPEAAALAAANKRVSNILKKAEGTVSPDVQQDLLAEAAEQALYQELSSISPSVQSAFAEENYRTALQELAGLRVAVDTFFDQVMVNADDPALRSNRLALLASLQRAMNQVADISKLAV